MDRRAIAIHERPVHLRRDVQQWCASRLCFDLRAGCIAGSCPGAGHHHAQCSRDSRVGVRHVDSSRLTASRHELNPALPRHRIEDRHVVNGNNTEYDGYAKFGQCMGNKIADRFVIGGGNRRKLGNNVCHGFDLSHIARNTARNFELRAGDKAGGWRNQKRDSARDFLRLTKPFQGNMPRTAELGVPFRASLTLVFTRSKTTLPLAGSTNPRTIEFTRMVGANSLANDFTRFWTPARAAEVHTM